MDICRQLISNPIDDTLSGELYYVMKNGSITATLTPPNSDSVPVNLPNTSLKNRFGPKVTLCVWWNFESVIRWKFVENEHAVGSLLYSQKLKFSGGHS